MALLPPPADAPRTAPTVRRGTKPQTPCTQGFRSASLSYRVPLAAAALHNPTAPAPSCRPAQPPTPSASPRFKTLLLKVSLPLAIASPFGASSPPRYPAWACRAVGSARDDRLYPPDGRLADLRQRLRDPRRTHRRCF